MRRLYIYNRWRNKPRVLWWMALCLLVVGCARMGNPDGGWYDDTPPRVVHASPDDRSTGAKSQRVTINFDEYIKIEDAQNKVIVSPPQLEMAEIRATGKRIIVDLKDTLKENTTYTIDFSDAISDNNEGNPMGNYTFSFSTGSEIDTLEVSGYALNAEDLEPIKGILVGLYEVPDSSVRGDSTALASDVPSRAAGLADSTFHKQPFVRVSRTNGSGRFTIKGVAPGRYYVYALQDADGDFVYGQKSEVVGYSHDVVVPSSRPDIRQDTVWLDSLRISDILRVGYTHFLPDDVTLLCFQAPQTDRYLIKTERKDPEKLGFFFSYGNDSLPRLEGLNFCSDSAFVVEASEKRDTVYYWLRDTALVSQDTLRLAATYLMTDSTGVLTEKADTLEFLPKVAYEKRQKLQQKEYEEWLKGQEKKKKRGEPYDSVMPIPELKVKQTVSGSITPEQSVWFEVPEPLAVCDTSAFHLYLKVDTLWYEASRLVEQLSPRVCRLSAEWRQGMEYSLEVDSAAMQGIYGHVSQAIKQGFKVKQADELATLLVNVSGTGADTSKVIVQLLASAGTPFQETVVTDGTAEFYYLPPGKYYLRAFVDLNGNGVWDTGNYDAGLQPEPVYYHPEEVECKAKWDVTRDWRFDALPRYRQKPTAIIKQKPDQAKQLRNRNAQRAAEKGIKYLEGKGVNIK